jgi:adenylate cyclase
MSDGKTSTPQQKKWKPSARAVSLLIVLAVFLCTLTARHLGWIQFLEFYPYDYLIRHQPRAPSNEPIVLVEMTEADIHSPSLDYPIYDDKLAELLTQLEAGQPAAIGLDIWRDIPVPKNGAGLPQFNQVLQDNSNIVAIFTLSGIAPPAILQSNADRIAFNDTFPADVEVDHTIPKVRRAHLTANTASGEVYDSLPFRLAQLYLERKDIQPEPIPGDPNSFRLGKARLRKFQPNDGAYVHADAGGWQMLLDFKCPDNFIRYSFVETLSGAIPPGALRDKIVLVGMNAPSVSDERVTPMQRNHRGIELQALTINQLLREALTGEAPLKFWNDLVEDAWILLWCLAGGAIGYWIRSPFPFAAATLACLVTLAGSVWMAFVVGWWIPAVTPVLGFVPATVLVVSYISAQERSMRKILMKLYSRHVSKEIAEAIWANRDSFLDGRRPLAQKLVVTVLFTDLKGFSTLSEKMEPSQLYTWLNGYLGAMAQVIQNHGGVLKQFTGDGILALFGVPVPHPSNEQQSADAAAAVRCALDMGRRLVELSSAWKESGLPSVSMRAGIYTGEVAAGSVGSDDRFEYAVIGDVVNTASRLESYDKTLCDPDLLPNRCRILIGAPTHDLLKGMFVSKEIGLLQVKGKVNKVPVFHILDEQALNQRKNDEPLPCPPVEGGAAGPAPGAQLQSYYVDK